MVKCNGTWKMQTFDFKLRFGIDRLGTEIEGEKHIKDITDFILKTRTNEVIIFDISNMAVFSHSYAKQTIGLLYRKLCKGEFDRRHFFVRLDRLKVVKDSKDKPSFGKISDLDKAMEKIGLPILVTAERKGADFYKEYQILGPLQPSLKQVLDIIIQKKEVMTNYLSRVQGDSLQNASNKVRKLEAMRLIEREIPSDRTGNVFLCKRIEIV